MFQGRSAACATGRGAGRQWLAIASCALLVTIASSCTPAMLIGIDVHGAPALPERSPAAARSTAARSTAGRSTAGRSTAPRSTVTPRLLMPVAGVRVGSVTNNFGAPRGNRRHEGIDIFAPRGTPVYSAAAGTVRFAGTTERGGWTVWIRSGGWDVWYTHLDAIAPGVRKGTGVDPDALLGWVGNSGNASGGATHLHFEVATATGTIDPLPLLADRD